VANGLGRLAKKGRGCSGLVSTNFPWRNPKLNEFVVRGRFGSIRLILPGVARKFLRKRRTEIAKCAGLWNLKIRSCAFWPVGVLISGLKWRARVGKPKGYPARETEAIILKTFRWARDRLVSSSVARPVRIRGVAGGARRLKNRYTGRR